MQILTSGNTKNQNGCKILHNLCCLHHLVLDLGDPLWAIFYLRVSLGRLAGKTPTAGAHRGADHWQSRDKLDGNHQLRDHARGRYYFHHWILDLRWRWLGRLQWPPGRHHRSKGESLVFLCRPRWPCWSLQRDPTFRSVRKINVRSQPCTYISRRDPI